MDFGNRSFSIPLSLGVNRSLTNLCNLFFWPFGKDLEALVKPTRPHTNLLAHNIYLIYRIYKTFTGKSIINVPISATINCLKCDLK